MPNTGRVSRSAWPRGVSSTRAAAISAGGALQQDAPGQCMGTLLRVGQHPGFEEVAGVGDQRGVLHDAPRDLAGIEVVDTVVAIVEVGFHGYRPFLS